MCRSSFTQRRTFRKHKEATGCTGNSFETREISLPHAKRAAPRLQKPNSPAADVAENSNASGDPRIVGLAALVDKQKLPADAVGTYVKEKKNTKEKMDEKPLFRIDLRDEDDVDDAETTADEEEGIALRPTTSRSVLDLGEIQEAARPVHIRPKPTRESGPNAGIRIIGRAAGLSQATEISSDKAAEMRIYGTDESAIKMDGSVAYEKEAAVIRIGNGAVLTDRHRVLTHADVGMVQGLDRGINVVTHHAGLSGVPSTHTNHAAISLGSDQVFLTTSHDQAGVSRGSSLDGSHVGSEETVIEEGVGLLYYDAKGTSYIVMNPGNELG